MSGCGAECSAVWVGRVANQWDLVRQNLVDDEAANLLDVVLHFGPQLALAH